MTNIEKLMKAQELLSEVYYHYGELVTENYGIVNPLSCADSCIIESIDAIHKLTLDDLMLSYRDCIFCNERSPHLGQKCIHCLGSN